MSITDELRKWAHGFNGPWKRNEETLLAIADRIDEAHQRELREQYNDGFDEGFASADDWDVDHAEELAEHGWVRLPVDADGEYIHVGDRLDVEYTTLPLVVEDMTLYSDDWRVGGLDPATLHHYKPTVEDVLREFVDRVCSSDHIVKDGKYFGIEDTGLLAEYAAKLQLRED